MDITFLIIGVAVFFNIAIIKYKFDRDRSLDALLDASLLILVGVVFSGAMGSLIIGTIGSALISIYLLFSPIRRKKHVTS